MLLNFRERFCAIWVVTHAAINLTLRVLLTYNIPSKLRYHYIHIILYTHCEYNKPVYLESWEAFLIKNSRMNNAVQWMIYIYFFFLLICFRHWNLRVVISHECAVLSNGHWQRSRLILANSKWCILLSRRVTGTSSHHRANTSTFRYMRSSVSISIEL